ncbi:carbohydrate ABC transporter permease [Breznakiella homolactica]|uniref:Sugar ABC transporter permease n=1 Tax=Breznakiella homolactica TaxID=2798577 RepID=A0A7T8B8Z7_9SPIR|nr:sugar ABC transporter permease [Breznakiella homolactica]QQO09109.1 sugar ABC transporter permease [Breznakiella homolactica]
MKALSLDRKAARSGVGMVLPAMIILGVFILYPIVQSFWMSLHDWNILKNQRSFTGISNYTKAFSDERFIGAMKNTLIYTVSYVPILIVTSLITAVFLNYGFTGAGFFKGLLFIPAITSMAIIAIIFRFLLDGDIGLVSIWLRNAGLPVKDFLRMPETAMGSVVFVGIWRQLGFNTVIFLSGLNAIPDSLYEAAEIDGAGRFRQFISVSLPLLMPTMSFVLITNLINSFQVFDQIYVMTKGGPMFSTEVLVYYIYYRGFNVFDMGYASALAFLLFCIILVITLFNLRGFGKAERGGGYG